MHPMEGRNMRVAIYRDSARGLKKKSFAYREVEAPVGFWERGAGASDNFLPPVPVLNLDRKGRC